MIAVPGEPGRQDAVALDEIASMTPGFTGADLANLVNEAALVATRRGAGLVAFAGGRGDGRGWNPLLEGDDDGVVTIACTSAEAAEEALRAARSEGAAGVKSGDEQIQIELGRRDG